MKKQFCFYSGLFLVTAAILMFQVIETRIISLVSWYYLSFFVISIAMFGLTAGAVRVYLRRDRFTPERLSRDLAYHAMAFAVATVLSLFIQLNMPLSDDLAGDAFAVASTVLSWAVLSFSIAVPFYLSGILVSLALTRSPFPIGRVYGVDLIGAAAGCLGVLFLLNLADGPSALLWVAAITALGGWFFMRSEVGQEDVASPFARRWLARPGLLAIVLAGLAVMNMSSDYGIHPRFIKGKAVASLPEQLFERWNSFSRVAQYRIGKSAPRMWGPSPRVSLSGIEIEQRVLNIDGEAGTASYRTEGNVERADFLRYDITNLAYYLPGLNSAAIIGVGGGRDMLSARLFGIEAVTGVEINPLIMGLLTSEPGFVDFTGLAGLPGMRFEVDEARSWFARSEERFDVVQMSLIDTWAATGAGAYTLTENGLYTLEAWRIFLDRVTPEGVFTVSRWYSPGEINETGRIVSLAMAALMDLGVAAPADHIFLAAAPPVATIVVSREPLGPNNLARLHQTANDLGYRIIASPRAPAASATLAAILESRSAAELRAVTASLNLDLTPPTDDRPFFFNQLPLRNIIAFLGGDLSDLTGGVVGGNLRATLMLVLLILLSAGLVAATIVVPLGPAIRDVGRRLALGGTAYFLLIGAGFMCAEIAFLQRMSVFLGHPIYSLSIVLFSMILSTGLGSLLSDRVLLSSMPRLVFWAGLTGAYLVSLTVWLPPLLLAYDSAGLLLRAAVTVAVIAPAGLLFGFGFPAGMRIVDAVDHKPTPWFWGINGAAGVIASSLAVLNSMAFGIGATILVAGLCYWLLIPAVAVIGVTPKSAPRSMPRLAEAG